MAPPQSALIYDFGASAAETVAFAKRVRAMLSTHTHINLTLPWPSFIPSLDILGEGIDRLEAAIQNAVNKDLKMIAARNEEHASFKKKMIKVAKFVELAVDDDAKALQEAGFLVRPERQPKPAAAGLPPAPVLSMKHGEDGGTMYGKVSRYRRALGYQVQMAEGEATVEADYKDVDIFPLASKMVIRGLQPGNNYSFRARIITSAGRGPWSVPCTLRSL